MLINMPNFSVTLFRKKIKNINLRIQRNGDVTVSAPLKTPLHMIHHFLDSKAPWIEAHRQRVLQAPPLKPTTLLDETSVLFQGVRLPIQWVDTKGKGHIEKIDNQIYFFIKPNATDTQKLNVLNQWYANELIARLPALFDKWTTIIGVQHQSVSIKRMKSRWGSCHPTKKHITLNLHLIEKPEICLEYVIVHELVHLLEPSHNHRFHAFMDTFMPNWKSIKKLLNA